MCVQVELVFSEDLEPLETLEGLVFQDCQEPKVFQGDQDHMDSPEHPDHQDYQV